LRENEAAEDCVHDVVLRTWQREHLYRPERGPLRAFLIVATRNDALTRMRTTARRHALLPRLYDSAVGADPAEMLIEPRLADHVARLPDEQRNVLMLAYARGMTHNEISEDLQLPIGTVKSRLHLALRRLARELGASPS
jgi:RNA polymerase sigma-70 factor, ECF subfamily